jgi:hypothetical protein
MHQEIVVFKQPTGKSDHNGSGRNVSVSVPVPTAINARAAALNRDRLPSAKPTEVLAEIFELLEEYGPAWYTEEHHDRIVAALKVGQ